MTDGRLAAALFVVSFVAYAYLFGGEGWNQNSHFDLTRALVERQTLHIDGYHANTGDISVGVGGRIYSNKAPGLSFIGAIPYAVIVGIEKMAGRSPDYLTVLNHWLVSASVCGVAGALIGVVLFLYGRRTLGVPGRAAMIVSLSILFGTIVFAYSTVFVAHVPAALFLLLAHTLLRRSPLWSGVSVGIATTCFYVCAIAAAVLTIAAWRTSSWRGATRVVAGGLPFAILLAIYHTICFGSPWKTAIEASTFTTTGLLFGVLQLPSRAALWGLTFSPYRGLFYTSPVLLMALIGMWRMRRRRDLRVELIALATVCIVFLLVIASFNFWHAGWAFGPRYLLPVIPLLGIAMMFAATTLRVVWIVLAAISLFINFLAAAVNPMPADYFHDPLRDELIPVFFRGRHPEAIAREFNLDPRASQRPVGRSTEARNVGELLFARGTRGSVAPVFVWIIAGSAALIALARRRESSVGEER